MKHVILFDVKLQHTLHTPKTEQFERDTIHVNGLLNMDIPPLESQSNSDIKLSMVLWPNSSQKLAYMIRGMSKSI